MKKLTEFKGSWAGLPIAWGQNDRLDAEVYLSDIDTCAKLGLPGVYTGGTTGEFYALNPDEFREITYVTVNQCQKCNLYSMIGVTGLCTREVIDKATFAYKCGADAIQVAFPFWLPISFTEAMQFLSEVSSATHHLPLSIYETGRSKFVLTLDQHLAIKESIDNYLMVKATVASSEILTPTGCRIMSDSGISVFADESSYYSVLGPYGLCGCCSSFVYYLPQVVADMNLYLVEGNWEELGKREKILKDLLEYLKQTVIKRGLYDSAIDRLGGISIGVLKTSLNCRAPYASATLEDVEDLRIWLAENHPDYVGHRVI